jgi:hypothetical protein
MKEINCPKQVNYLCCCLSYCDCNNYIVLFESRFLFLSKPLCNSLFRLAEMRPHGHATVHIYVSLASSFRLDDVRELDNPQWRTVCSVQFKLSESSRDVCLLKLTQFRRKRIWVVKFGSAAPSRLQSTNPKYTELLFIWLWNLICRMYGTTWSDGVRKQGVEGGIGS